jgi:hypothetical protein
MKTLLTEIVALIAFVGSAIGESEWTHKTEEGEDATSTHYYYFKSNGDSVEQVRWVWNGGAQNLPTVTDYFLGSGRITVRHLVGKREDITDLILGREADLELKEEYSITAKSTGEMLIPDPPEKSLSDTQRVDLKNLIDLLAKERKPFKTRAQQDEASKP